MTVQDPQGRHFATPASLIIDASRVWQSETCGARHGSLYSPAWAPGRDDLGVGLDSSAAVDALTKRLQGDRVPPSRRAKTDG